jgi:CheY-like chemotaxis protein
MTIPGQRSLLNSFLRSQGFETSLADSGERALEMLRAGKFAMMISDVRMPGLTGLETLRRVRPNISRAAGPARHRLYRHPRRRGRDARRRGQLSGQAD